ncbi:MAG TPA: flippase [Oligoflexus sp.]|uniref:flippase n=1 Tax=Oligoflexus sp. TaxID=1971216 RepID=UPI002D65A8CE|nr:flippase [Oligoflexus sp.]HYX34484.1 flippase [Oligoflexus sp.]
MDDSQHSTHRKIARNVSLLSLSVGMTMVIGLALKMLLPRIMGPEKMGIFYFADSFTNAFFAFLPLGFTTYINRTIPSDHNHVRDIFGTIVLVELFMAALIGVIMFVSLILFKRTAGWETWGTVMIMGIYAATFHFQRNILHKIFMSVDKVRLVSVINVVVKIVLVGGCLVAFKFHPTILMVAVMHAISEIFGLAYMMYQSRRHQFFGAGPSMDRLKVLLKVSLPFYMAGVLTTFFTETDTNMLSFMSSDIEVGYFGSANKLIGVFLLLIPILQSSFTPALSQALHEGQGNFEKLYKQLMNVLLVCSLPLSVVLVLFGDYIARILYGDGFQSSYKILCFLTPVLTMMYINTFTGACLYLSSPGGQISRIFIIGLAINVALDYVAIPFGLKFGPGGAGLAVSFCTFICEVYTFLAMVRIFPNRVLDLKLLKNILVILAPCWLGMLFYDPMVALNLWQRLAIAALAPFYALLTRLVTIAEIRAFVRFLRSTLTS